MKNIMIKIPEPCRESWQCMAPDATGRFCNSCEKSVIDFTAMSDRELADFFKKPKENACGRFHADQLDRNLPLPGRQLPWLKYFFTISIPAFLLSFKSSAQQKACKPEVKMTVTKSSASPVIVGRVASRSITGIVTDESGQPLRGVSVVIPGRGTGTATDENGSFILHVPPGKDTVVFTAISHLREEILIAGRDSINVRLKKHIPIYLGGVVTVSTKRIKKRSKPLLERKAVVTDPVIQNNDITVFPNPVTGNSNLNISWKNKIEGEQLVLIFSSVGEVIQTERISALSVSKTASLHLKEMPAGLYIMQVTDLKTNKKLSKEFAIR